MGTKTQKEEIVNKYSDIQGKFGSFTSFTNTSTYSMASNSADLVNFSSCNIALSFVDMPTCNGMLNKHLMTVLGDTGCYCVVVRRDLLCDDQLTGVQKVRVLADGSRIQVPVARVKVNTPCFTGNVEAWCLKNPFYSLIIGNIPNARDPKDPDRSWKPNQTNVVVTRQQSRNETKKLYICVYQKLLNLIFLKMI